MLKAVGVTPDYYMGHSLGETACGYLAGFQTEEQTIKIAMMRSEIVQCIRAGYSYLITDKDNLEFDKVAFENKIIRNKEGTFLKLPLLNYKENLFRY